jgi:hypothetical protein
MFSTFEKTLEEDGLRMAFNHFAGNQGGSIYVQDLERLLMWYFERRGQPMDFDTIKRSAMSFLQSNGKGPGDPVGVDEFTNFFSNRNRW